jgi:Ca2+-binding RTX toxin-like protein
MFRTPALRRRLQQRRLRLENLEIRRLLAFDLALDIDALAAPIAGAGPNGEDIHVVAPDTVLNVSASATTDADASVTAYQLQFNGTDSGVSIGNFAADVSNFPDQTFDSFEQTGDAALVGAGAGPGNSLPLLATESIELLTFDATAPTAAGDYLLTVDDADTTAAPFITAILNELDEQVELDDFGDVIIRVADEVTDEDVAFNFAVEIPAGHSLVDITADDGVVVDNGDGTQTYTPAENFFGHDVIAYVISDGAGATAVNSFTIAIGEVNDTPVEDTPIADIATAPGQSTVIDALAGVSDVDFFDTHTVGEIAFGTQGTVVDNGDGTLTYTADGGATEDSITFEVTDGRGGTIQRTVNINITPNQFYTDGEDVVFVGSNGRDRIRVIPIYKNNGIMIRTNTTSYGPLTVGANGMIRIVAGEGNDSVTVSGYVKFPLRVEGGAGNDTINGGKRDDVLLGGIGNDWINAGEGANQVWGNSGNDRIVTGKGNDIVHGGDGMDHIMGGRGDDTLTGGGGDDTILGEWGSDFIDGGDGDDNLNGNSGADLITGRDGFDQLRGGGGTDVLIGGVGWDRLSGGQKSDAIITGELSLDDAGLAQLLSDWSSGTDLAERIANSTIDATDDGERDKVASNGGADYIVDGTDDVVQDLRANDRLASTT